MRDVKLNVKGGIGTSIVGEHVEASSVSGQTTHSRSDLQEKLIEIILRQANSLRAVEHGISQEQLLALGDKLIAAINAIKTEPDYEKKKGIYMKSLETIKSGAAIVEALEPFFKLGSTLIGGS